MRVVAKIEHEMALRSLPSHSFEKSGTRSRGEEKKYIVKKKKVERAGSDDGTTPPLFLNPSADAGDKLGVGASEASTPFVIARPPSD